MVTDVRVGLDEVRAAPADDGVLELIARRPAVDERELLEEGALDVERGFVGDTWSVRGSRPNPKAQVTLMNARAAALVAGERDRWALAGDQLYVDLDLSVENLPPGTRLRVGTALLEVSDQPHLGCKKFKARFGGDALRFVNSRLGRQLRLRGVNTSVVEGGKVCVGDAVRRATES